MKRIILLLPFLFLLCGCYPYTEVENMDILTSVYIGKDAEEILLGGGVANVRSFSDAMADEPVSLLYAKGADLEETILHLRESADHALFYGALRAVVLHEAYCSGDIKAFMTYLDARPRLRRSTAVFVTDADLEEVVGYQPINDFSAGFAADSIIMTLFEEKQMRYTSIGDVMYAFSCGATGYSVPRIVMEDGVMRVDGYALFQDGKLVGNTDNPALTAFTTDSAVQYHLCEGTSVRTRVRKRKVDVRVQDGELHVSVDFIFDATAENGEHLREKQCVLLSEKLRTQTEQVLTQSKTLGCDFPELYKEAMTKGRADFDMQTWNALLKKMTYTVQVQVVPK